MVVRLGFLSGLFALAEVCSDLLAEFIAVFGVPKSLRWCTLIYTSMGLNLCLLVVVNSLARKRFGILIHWSSTDWAYMFRFGPHLGIRY